MANNNDRRVRRTRRLLEAALLSLLKEKEFDSITVSEILHRADVGRATFYAHYDNKEDLLESGFDGLLAVLREERRTAPPAATGPLSFSRHLLAHAHEHRAIFPSLTSEHGGPFLQHVLRRLLLRLVRDEVEQNRKPALPANRQRRGTPVEAQVQFLAGGLFGLLMAWMGGRLPLSVDEMDDLFRRLAAPALD